MKYVNRTESAAAKDVDDISISPTFSDHIITVTLTNILEIAITICLLLLYTMNISVH